MSTRRLSRVVLLFALAGVAGSCGALAGSRTVPLDDGRSGAALATVTVHNETAHLLEISFRPATPPGDVIVVGRVEPGERAVLAPVPADEPIILIARTPTRAELVLPARTFEIDATWLWHIPADASFRARAGDSR